MSVVVRRSHPHVRRRLRARGCAGRRRPVSHDLQKMIWQDPEAKGNTKLVLLCLGSYVSHDAWKQGRDLLAWPSQNTVARRCGIQRSTVERALKELLKLQKIADTGKRKQRRSVVYELYPSTAPDLPDPEASVVPDLPRSEASHDMPGDGASGTGGGPNLPDSAHDLPDPEGDLPDSAASTCPILQHKRVRRGLEESELGEMQVRAGARGSVEGDDLAGELAEVEALLAERPADKLLTGRRDELRESLGAEVSA